MNNHVKVSIIIPVYNTEAYLAKTLDCLLKQTLREIEIICINDCSQDNSLKILKEYSQKDKRVKIIDLKKNQGAAIARNKGLEIACGEYLGFVDSDDIVDNDFYEKLYQKSIKTGADITKANCKIVDLDGSERISDLNKIIVNTSKYHFTWQWWCAIYKASMIYNNGITFPKNCPKGQDVVFLNRAVLKSNTVETVDDVYYHYIRRKNSLDCKKLTLKSFKSGLLCEKLIAKDLNSSDLFKKNREDYCYIYLRILEIVVSYLFRTDNIEAKKLSAQTLIDIYYESKDVEFLDKNFPYRILLNLLKDRKYDELSKVMAECKSARYLKYAHMTFLQNIFSIQTYGKYKLYSLLGIRIKIKNFKKPRRRD